MIHQLVPTLFRVSDSEFSYYIVVKPSVIEIILHEFFFVAFKIKEVIVEISCSLLVNVEEFRYFARQIRTAGILSEVYARSLRESFHGFHSRYFLVFLNECNYVSARLAGETMIDLFRLRYVQRRVLVGMKRAKSDESAAPSFNADVRRNHIHYIVRSRNLIKYFVGNSHNLK